MDRENQRKINSGFFVMCLLFPVVMYWLIGGSPVPSEIIIGMMFWGWLLLVYYENIKDEFETVR